MSCALTPPSNPYGTFAEKGYDFEAHIQASATERQAFLVRVLRDGVPLLELTVPLLHPPLFGVDVADHALLEAATESLVQALPPAAQWSTTVLPQLTSVMTALGCPLVLTA